MQQKKETKSEFRKILDMALAKIGPENSLAKEEAKYTFQDDLKLTRHYFNIPILLKIAVLDSRRMAVVDPASSSTQCRIA